MGLGHWEIHAPEKQISLIECPIEGERGDVNGDGVVKIIDAVLAVNFILGDCCQTTVAPKCWIADCDADGVVNVQDVIGIVNAILEIGTCPP
ncbi:MAG: dockerin type I repeat-containing protein [bacterium]